MRTINENNSILSFDAWAGATSTKDDIVEAGLVDEFDALIEDIYPDGITETQLNDILWHDSDWVYETLGMEVE